MDNEGAGQLNKLRRLRNSLIHGKTGQLSKMAKKRYWVTDGEDSFLDAEFYVQSGIKGGIDQDALLYLGLVRDLTVKFYGAKE